MTAKPSTDKPSAEQAPSERTPHQRDATGESPSERGAREKASGVRTTSDESATSKDQQTKSEPGSGSGSGSKAGSESGSKAESKAAKDQETKTTVWVALAANLVIALAKVVGGLFAGSPALLSEAAHSIADSMNEVFLLAALRRSRKPADPQHPFGYGKERYFWSLLAAVGIFVTGGCFSVFQGVEALRSESSETTSGYIIGLVVLGVAFLAEGGSLVRALWQVRGQEGGIGSDPALRTVIAEDGTAVLGVTLAMIGMGLHMATGQVAYEAAASIAIGLLLIAVAYRLGKDARDQLIGEAVDPELREEIAHFLAAQPEIDRVESLLTMRLGMDSTLVAARIDLAPGRDSEVVELVMERIKSEVAERWPQADQVFLDVTEAPPLPGAEVDPNLTA